MSDAFMWPEPAEDKPPGWDQQEADTVIPPLPRISIQAFCETQEIAGMIEEASADRRMTKTITKIMMGGMTAAIAAFRDSPTPNLIVIETSEKREQLIWNLETLATSCDSGTKVVVIGRENDIGLYRDLMRRGVSDYIVTPVSPVIFISQLSNLYSGEVAKNLGRTIGVIGAKGGVGASTIAHNLAWLMTSALKTQAVIVDLDLPFGTAGLDFNQDPPQGIADAIYSPERIDETFIDRLMTKCSDTLSILPAPANLERFYDLTETAVDATIDILRATTPVIILDIPHQWTAWTRHVITTADEVVIVAAPDLANMRNVKALIDALKTLRRNDRPPYIILNGVGVPKRPEISPSEFAKALNISDLVISPFDAKLYGTAANNGQMLDEIDPSAEAVSLLTALGYRLMGRPGPAIDPKGPIRSMLSRLGFKKAS